MPAAGVLAALQPTLVPGLIHAPQNPPFWPNLADIAYAVLDSYAYTVRYVDDMLSIANPNFGPLMYTFQVWHIIAVIYPGPYQPAVAATAVAPAHAAVPGLELKQAGSGHCLSYLDVFVKVVLEAQPTGTGTVFWVELLTAPYAKHRDGPLKGLGVIKYPHISCDLAAQVKYNILNTEWHRWMSKITSLDGFALSVAHLVHDLAFKGYMISMLLIRIANLARQHPGIWPRDGYRLFMKRFAFHTMALFVAYNLGQGMIDEVRAWTARWL
jgi:hypothetical protein